MSTGTAASYIFGGGVTLFVGLLLLIPGMLGAGWGPFLVGAVLTIVGGYLAVTPFRWLEREFNPTRSNAHGGRSNPLNYCGGGDMGPVRCETCGKLTSYMDIVHCNEQPGFYLKADGSTERYGGWRFYKECKTCNGWDAKRANGIPLGTLLSGESRTVSVRIRPEA